MGIHLNNLLSETFTTEYAIMIKLETGLSVGAAGIGATLADKAIVKDGSERFMIPGSHLKGRLRHECERLYRALGRPVCESPRAELMCPQLGSREKPSQAESLRQRILNDVGAMPCAVCRLFGNPTTSGALQFSDLICQEMAASETIRNRVAINRRRRTAEDKKLFFIETAPVGAEIEFTGKLFAQRDLTVDERKLLAAAFTQIRALGGGKTGGTGWLLCVRCEEIGIELTFSGGPCNQ